MISPLITEKPLDPGNRTFADKDFKENEPWLSKVSYTQIEIQDM